MKKLFWRIAMWRTAPSHRVSYETWDANRIRKRRERELKSVNRLIERYKRKVRRHEEIRIARGDSFFWPEDLENHDAHCDSLRWYLDRKDQLMFELGQSS
jgi:hypothetical protein